MWSIFIGGMRGKNGKTTTSNSNQITWLPETTLVEYPNILELKEKSASEMHMIIHFMCFLERTNYSFDIILTRAEYDIFYYCVFC